MFAVIHHKQPMNLLTNINKSWHLKAASSMSSKTTSSQHQKCQARFQKHIYNTVLPCLQQPGNCSITFVLKNSVIKSQLTRVPYTTTPGLQFSALPLVAFFFVFLTYLHRIYHSAETRITWNTRTFFTTSFGLFTRTAGPHRYVPPHPLVYHTRKLWH